MENSRGKVGRGSIIRAPAPLVRLFFQRAGFQCYNGGVKRLLSVLIILILCFALLPRLLVFLYPAERNHFYDGFFGYALGAVFAAFLVWVAWEQLANLGKTSSADFIHRLNGDFFRAQTRALFDLLDAEALEFVHPQEHEAEGKEAWPYFRVNKTRISQTTYPDDHAKRITRRESYSSWEIDEMLLGHLEDVGNLERRRIVDFSLVLVNFRWYIEFAWKNRHIQAYLQYQRTEYPEYPNLWPGFEYIAKKCLEYSRLSPGPCRWWWLFKRNFLRIAPR